MRDRYPVLKCARLAPGLLQARPDNAVCLRAATKVPTIAHPFQTDKRAESMRFKIVDLLVVTAIFALGCAALMSRDGRLPEIFFQVTAATLGYAALQVACSRMTRPFWLGYLTFGAARLAMNAVYSERTPESALLEWLALRILRLPFSTDIALTLSCLITLLVATIGGVIGILVAHAYDRPKEKTGPS